MLQAVTEVLLLDFEKSVDLNYKQDVLHTYSHDSQRWVVELPCVRKVKVCQANMQTMEASAQIFYSMLGLR